MLAGQDSVVLKKSKSHNVTLVATTKQLLKLGPLICKTDLLQSGLED